MTLFVLVDATGVGAGQIDSNGAFTDLAVIANDTGLGLDPQVNGSRRVTYTRTVNGPPQLRLDELVNTAFQPDYGSGPQAVDIVVVSVPDNFVFGDGSFGLVNNGTALPPSNSGLPGAGLNPTTNCLVLYDTDVEICLARDGTGGTLDLPAPGSVVLFHELSHARRVVRNELLALTTTCNPSSPEERAAIIDENDMRTQLADLLDETPVLRDPGIHCAGACPGGGGGGSCCIVATVSSGSTRSPHVQRLRALRDGLLRTTEVGHAFFEQLHYDYYAFSPQVVTLIGGRPALRDAVLRGYVEPLLDFWEIVAARSTRPGLDDAALGQLVLDHLPDGPSCRERLEVLRQTQSWWDGRSTGGPDVPDELLELLRRQASPRETVQWALIEPLVIGGRLLQAVIDDDHPATIGAMLRELLDEWTPQVPLSPVWGALPVEQLTTELALYDAGLFCTDTARQAFRARLAHRFPTVTAIARVAGPAPGGPS